MASIKTNKIKNPTPLLKTNFLWIETLLLGPKRFLHSKGPKNAICLCLSQRKITFLGPLQWRNLFGPKSKVSRHEKLVFRSGVRFLFLFVWMDAILQNPFFLKNQSLDFWFFCFCGIAIYQGSRIYIICPGTIFPPHIYPEITEWIMNLWAILCHPFLHFN